jgi:hypothetical protein
VLTATAVRDVALEFAAGIDPDAVPLPEVTAVWKNVLEAAQILTGVATLLARRVEDAEAWKAAGFKCAADAIAATAGTSIQDAKQVLETSRNVASLPATADAMRSGTLSPAKADLIAAAAVADPTSEKKLLATAELSVAEVKTECLRVRAAAAGDELYDRITRERQARTYTDAEGAWNLHARGPADKGTEIAATLDEITDEIFKQNYKSGRRDPRDAYAFDALVEMARRAREGTDSKGSTSKPLSIQRVDVETLRRGWVEGEEVCEIAGVGPVPVRIARQVLGDAVLKLVITKGVDVLNVTHLGRGATAAQKVALWWQSPMCDVAGCGRVHRLEIDHKVEWAKTKHTKLEELQRLCEHHHDMKTRFGWKLVEGTGPRPMVPPEDPRHPRNRPPPRQE